MSQTFTASATAIAAGNVILDELITGDYFGPDGKVVRLHERFKEKLVAISARHPDLLRGPYGLGAMMVCTPLGGDAQRVYDFVQQLFANGVMSFVAGASPTRVRFLLPIGAIKPDDIDAATVIIEETLVSM